MLTRILDELQNTRGTINLNELSQKLCIEQSAMQGMIQYLVQTGHLVNEEANKFLNSECICASCGTTCPPSFKNGHVADITKTYSYSRINKS